MESSMSSSGVQLQQHAIAPAVVVRGEGAWAEALPAIQALCRRPLLLGRSAATHHLREQLGGDLRTQGLLPAAVSTTPITLDPNWVPPSTSTSTTSTPTTALPTSVDPTAAGESGSGLAAGVSCRRRRTSGWSTV